MSSRKHARVATKSFRVPWSGDLTVSDETIYTQGDNPFTNPDSEGTTPYVTYCQEDCPPLSEAFGD